MDEKTPHMHMGIVLCPLMMIKSSQLSVNSIVKPYSAFKRN